LITLSISLVERESIWAEEGLGVSVTRWRIIDVQRREWPSEHNAQLGHQELNNI